MGEKREEHLQLDNRSCCLPSALHKENNVFLRVSVTPW